MTKTFYDVLRVSADASTEEIRAAYRERLKESHPDLSDDEDANAVTRRIIRARDVLTDQDVRLRYDRLGHDEFVGNTDSAVDESDVSDAAAAARRAGWADDRSDGTAGSEADEEKRHSRANGRRRARERRRRERVAQERVEGETGRETAGETRRTSKTTTDGGSTATATGASGSGGVSGSARSWNGSGGYSVRREYEAGFQRRRLFPTGKSLTLLIVAFVLFPLMLFSALFPPFPIVVNVVVGLCTIFLVGYLQSRPEVGVLVFGVWSLITPVAFVVAGVPLTGLVGIAALTATWLPLGLSVLTLSLVRP